MEDSSDKEDKKNMQRKIASIFFTIGIICGAGWGILSFIVYYEIISGNSTLDIITWVFIGICICCFFAAMILHPESRETIIMANKESATTLKKVLRIILIGALVFIVILIIFILLGIFTDWVIIEVD